MATTDLLRQRSYQRAPLLAMDNGIRRFVEVLHRRAGKDRNWMGICLLQMLKRVGVYYHVFPTLNQGRRDVWDNIVHENYGGVERSMRMIDMFPAEIRDGRPNETEMQTKLINGSIYQIMGADDEQAIKRMRGPNPVGLIFSEHAFMRPGVWEVLSPVLAENGGWAAFISTPNQEDDDFHRLYKYALKASNWFCQLKTIEQTSRDAIGEDGSPVIPLSEIEDLRRQGVREETIQREYYCSFKGFAHGTIYGDLLERAAEEERIGRFPYRPGLPVGLMLDVGKADTTACWFYQLVHGTVVFIDYEEDTQKSPQWWAQYLKERKNYLYGRMLLPWDGYAWEAYFSEVGFRNITVLDRTKSVQADIDKVRTAFSTFLFDEVNCREGIEHLRRYHRTYDETKRIFSNDPLHDEHSHAADALRTGIVGGTEPLVFPNAPSNEVKVVSDFDPRMS